MRAWRAWLFGAAIELRTCCDVRPELAGIFCEGTLRDEAELRRWFAALAEDEAQAELERIRAAPQPELHKTSAQERARRRVAKWRLSSPRVYLKGLLNAGGQPLLTREERGIAVTTCSGEVFGRQREVKTQAEDCF